MVIFSDWLLAMKCDSEDLLRTLDRSRGCLELNVVIWDRFRFYWMCGLAAEIVGVLPRKLAPDDLSGQVISSENVFREGGTQIFLKHDENVLFFMDDDSQYKK